MSAPPLTLHAPEARHHSMPPRALYTRTATGLVIGSAWQRPRTPADAGCISGPQRAADTLGDKAVRYACAVALVFVVVLLVWERLA